MRNATEAFRSDTAARERQQAVRDALLSGLDADDAPRYAYTAGWDADDAALGWVDEDVVSTRRRLH